MPWSEGPCRDNPAIVHAPERRARWPVRPMSRNRIPSQGEHEGYQVLLFLICQPDTQDKVEVLHRVIQGQQSSIVQVGRRVLDAAEREGLDRAVVTHHHAVLHMLLVEAFRMKIVHRVVGKVRGCMAACTLSLAEEDLLPAQLGGGGLGWVQFAVPSQLWRWREVENLLKFRHRTHLASALQYIGAFLCRNHLIAIEVGGSLLELRKVLNRLQGPLGTEEPLNVQAAQCRSFNAMAKLLWPDIAHQVEGAI